MHFFAVINVVTKKGQAVERAAAVRRRGQPAHRARARGLWRHVRQRPGRCWFPGRGTGAAVRRALYFQEFDDPATNNGIAENLDDDADYNLFGSLSFKGLSFQGVYGSRDEASADGIVRLVVQRSAFRDHVTPRAGRTCATFASFPASWQLTGRAYYDRQAYSGRYPCE